MSGSNAVAPSSIPAPAFVRRAARGTYDEWFGQDGSVREFQSRLHDYFTTLAPDKLQRLRVGVRDRINQQEVTFNILGAPGGTTRPWRLDAIPLVMDPVDWEVLSSGLRQRARLLSAMYKDLYGSQRLLQQRILPAELVLGNPGLPRACFGWRPSGGHRLQLYAADIGRGPDGRFRIYSDRVAAPAGAGYALENRLVMSRSLPSLFEAYGVERVRGFFDTVRRSIQELAPNQSEEPRVVLLSAGPRDESSFEHAYLARYLGYELVEGRDLTVRDRVVFLKTLSGLKRVDVILRRINDEWCDPLALRGDSALGVPGLVEAASAQNVALANPLGVNILEAPALKPYFAAAAKFLLDEELELGSAEAWWCGEPQGLAHALEHVDELAFKPAFGDRTSAIIRPSHLDAVEKERFLARLMSHPGNYVAERWCECSGAPVLESGGLSYGAVSMRCFLCRDGDAYRVMPGGLARLDAPRDGLFLPGSGAEASKDVWVPATTERWSKDPAGMPDRRVELRRGGLDLPSRLLDDIFWLGRYVERCEMTARLLRAGFDRLGSEPGQYAELVLGSLADSLETLEVVPPSTGPKTLQAITALFTGAMLDDTRSSSLLRVCRRIHQLTLTVRSRLSRDAWHVLRRLSQPLERHMSSGGLTSNAAEALDDVLVILSAVGGIMLDNMVRGHAWIFLDMGRRVERGSTTLSLVQSMLPPGASRVHMEALLEVADSLLTYRARYLSSLQVAPVVDLLLTDDTNPRSLLFQINTLMRHVRELPRLGGAVRSRAERRAIELQSNLLTADVQLACSGDGEGLRQLVEDSSTLLWQFSDDVTHTWFSHVATSHAVAPPRWINEELEVV
jgi:uncharacterized circularly permuted ATP-grasp superfamily protein/uncharacterized alpha-E superfamily protein